MTSERELLPSWKECRRILENEKWCKENAHTQIEEEKPTELHRFIYEYEPCGIEETKYFRKRLAKLLKWNRPSQALEGIEWPEKKDVRDEEIVTGRPPDYVFGFNACHDAFMAKIKNVRGE